MKLGTLEERAKAVLAELWNLHFPDQEFDQPVFEEFSIVLRHFRELEHEIRLEGQEPRVSSDG